MMLDDLVAPNALVRVVDAWIESLDLTQLGFSKTQPQRMGRHPTIRPTCSSFTCAAISVEYAHRVHSKGSAIATSK
jgi:hypothetical protein